MSVYDRLETLFRSIDQKDLETFQSFIHAEGSFQYGSFPAAEGKEAVGQFVGGFFERPFGMRHQIHQSWQADAETILALGTVTYLFPEDKEVPVDFLNLFRLKDDQILEYRVFIDPTPIMGAL